MQYDCYNYAKYFMYGKKNICTYVLLTIILPYWLYNFECQKKLIYVKIFMFSESIHNWEKEHMNFSFVSCKFYNWNFLK